MSAPRSALGRLTLAGFSEQLASSEPIPGGGSASAVVASFAASLLAMVARLSLDRPKYEQYRSTNEEARDAAETARTRLLMLADDDSRAYGGFAQARKLPKETPEEQQARTLAVHAAAREASDVPLAVVRECAALLTRIESAAGRSNVNAASDLEVAARLTAAAGRGAAANVFINLPMVDDEVYARDTTIELEGLIMGMDRVVAQVAETLGSGAARSPEGH